jgi:predicted metal-dependent hydrolase
LNDAIQVVRHPRARRMRLAVDPRDGSVRLTLPPRASLNKALAWAREQGGWIERQRAALPTPRPFTPGASFPLRGVDVTITWDPQAPRTPRLERDTLRCGGPLDGLDKRIERWLRRQALALLTAETTDYAAIAGVTVSRVAIGDPRGRWGSCASSGAIRYSWRLILAPDAVRRATVAHEVAHRLHMDHSPAFHAAHAALFEGDAAGARAWLRRNGAALHWVGRAV